MMRLLATVWKATVAMPWHTATSTMASTAKARLCARRQKTGVPNCAGFFHTSSPMQARIATAHTAPKAIHQRRRAAGETKAPVRLVGRLKVADEAVAGEAETASAVGEGRVFTGRPPCAPGAGPAR